MRGLLAFLLVVTVAAGWAAPASAQTGSPGEGPGGPVLVVVNDADPFGRYYAEILRAEGLNAFSVAPIGSVSAATLAAHQAVVLAPTALSDGQAAMFAGWVQGGGNLVAMRPDPRLAGLLGLSGPGGSLDEGYLRVAGSGPGAGITGETMQFHGRADRYALAGATAVATLFNDASTGTANPAVSLNAFGAGQAAAFTYDLARSVVGTRQGDVGRRGQELDGETQAIRSSDLFHDPLGPLPEWLDMNKVAIPQADEQQRLLANLLTQMTADRIPLPRFWYLPRGEKAAVIMTGDDHGGAQTAAHFDLFDARSPAGCNVADWRCVRGTSYVFSGALPAGEAAAYQADGFEVALHLNTGCEDYTPQSLAAEWDQQLIGFSNTYPGIAAPATNRTHCIVWSDWAGTPRAGAARGIRLDTNYYYWPGSWVQNRPGMFTGSGFPMRFADIDGSLIDVYQAATQITDESGVDYSQHITALLDNALGANGFYGTFTMNFHTDSDPASAAIVVDAARARGVPVITARQMLEWLDGRNQSTFAGLSFTSNLLRFTLQRGAGSRGLEAMLPLSGPTGALRGLTRDGAAVGLQSRTVKGIQYAVFDGAEGNYVATYGDPPPASPAGGAGAGGSAGAGGAPGTGSAGGSGGSGPAGDRTAPRVRITPSRARVSRTGSATLRVACPASERSCRVDLKVLDGRRSVAPRKTLTIAGGKSARVVVRLSRAARRKLNRAGGLRVTAVLAARDQAGNRATTRTAIRLLPFRN